MPATFILTDESVNCYGYRVLTSGAELDRFRQNPVMLYSHDNHLLPIGTWQNLRVEGTRLLADAAFDLDDPFAAEVARKVEAGILRCCSIGFDIIEVSDDQSLLLPGQTQGTVTRWQLLECSLCAIGANPAAMKLVAGQHITLSYLNNQTNQTTPTNQNNQSNNNQNQTTMPNQENQELTQMRQELATLRQQNQTLAQERDQLRQAAQQARDGEINHLLSAAIADGRLSEAERPHWDKLLHADHDSATAALAALTPRSSLSRQLRENGSHSEFAGKSWNDLDRAGRLAAFKEQDPEAFRQLYRQTFGTDYVG